MQDMKAVWHMQAATPGQELFLRIGVQHPDYGNYFQAILKAKRVERAVDPEAFTWIMPHKVAFWIYWQVMNFTQRQRESFVPAGYLTWSLRNIPRGYTVLSESRLQFY